MTLDGRGERATTTFGRYRDDSYEKLGEVLMPHSLGILYERITDHLGFLHSSDEYKVMALAALGEPRNFEYLNSKIRVSGGSFELAPIDFEEVFGPKRRLGEELTQSHFDAAASVQKVLETTVLALARWLRRESGEQQLAVAGGVALNCVMNSVLRDSGIFNQVWIQPAAGDAGTALGAALWIDAQQRAPAGASADRGANRLAPRHWQMRDAYLGPEFSDTEIEHQLTWAKLEYTRVDDLAEATAKLLADNCVIGWFQGRMEFGPRALGARSILASPIDPDMQKRINELKDREDFRPVAPMVLKEKMSDWFTPAEANDGESPFMLFLYNVAPGQARNIPSACHVDETARVQTVDRESNPQVHALLEAFGRRTGVPVLINTSFNVRGEPIVCTPKAAIEAFFSTPLDALVMGSFVVLKAGQTHRQTS
jgi:carbamoyltransferase